MAIFNGGAGNDTFAGNDQLDTIYGGGGNDTLYGGNGADLIYGGTGNDLIWGDAGNDSLIGAEGDDRFYLLDGFGNDTIDGTESSETTGDTLDASGLTGTVTLTYGNTGENGTLANSGSTANFSNIESVLLGAGSDSINASATGNALRLDGGLGNDTITGGGGTDTVYGGSGDDLLFGGGGTNALYGGTGNDTLNTSYIYETMQGGDGDDRFVFANTNILATITGGTTGETGGDIVDASASTFNTTLTYSGLGAGSYTQGYNNSFSEIEKFLLGSGADSVTGSSASIWVDTGAGNDSVTGGSAADTVFGGAANDTIYGGAGADRLSGDAGNDLIEGGAGADILDGGAGEDTLSYGNSTLGVSVDLGAGSTSLGDAAGDVITGFEHILGSGFNDTLMGGTGANNIQGGAGNDALYGGAGADTIYGGTGNDLIWGDAGNDSLNGAEGDDRFYLLDGFGNDTIDGTESSETTGDTLDTSGLTGTVTLTYGNTGENGTLAAGGSTANFSNIESVLLGAGNDSVNASATGNALRLDGGLGNDTITGGGGTDTVYGGSGDDLLFGGGGTNALYGGTGNDTLNTSYIYETMQGGDGDDRFVFANTNILATITGGTTGETGGDIVDASASTFNTTLTYSGLGAGSYTQGYNNSFSEIEKFLLGSGADSVTASSASIWVDTGAGNDSVTGGSAADTVFGGAANDTIYGGAGADSLSGDAGNDLIEGGAGADTLDGGAGEDTLSYGNSTLGVSVDLGAGSPSLGDAAGDVITGFEHILGSGFNDTLMGGTGANNIQGGAGNDALYGGAGADTIYGGTGNDLIWGDAGNDSLNGAEGDDRFYLLDGFGNDTIDGTESSETTGDILDASGLTGTVTLTYGNTGENGTLSAGGSTANFSNIESVLLGAGNDSVNASATGNALRLDGGLGNDTLIGGGGVDTLYGGGGDDLLYGGGGSSALFGGAGNDTLNTSYVYDTLQGGDGDDRFVFSNTNILATITGGSTGETNGDIVDASASTFNNTLTYTGTGGSYTQGYANSFSEVEKFLLGSGADTVNATAATVGIWVDTGAGIDSITGSALADTVYAGLGNDLLTLGAGNDVTYAGAGDDLFAAGDTGDDLHYGGAGNDTIYGDAGRDTIYGEADNDLIYGGAGNDATYAGAGNDRIEAGTGGDYVEGGDGDDQILGDSNLILNGSFETSPAVTTFLVTPIAGWSNSGDSGNNLEVWYTGFNAEAPPLDGVKMIELDVSTGVDRITQSVGTTAGETMVLSFGAQQRGTLTDSVEVYWRGNLIGTVTPTADWTTYNFTVTGSGGNDALELRELASQNTGTGPLIDKITLYAPANDTLSGGAGNDLIDGGAGDDILYGGADQDTLIGWVGNDALYGGAGNDQITGDSGNDLIEGGAGADLLDGGADQDTLSYAASSGAVVVDIGANTAALGDAAGDTISGFEHLIGSDFNDSLTGSLDANSIWGGAGNDTINGGAGADSLSGGDGDDRFNLTAGFGNDTIAGGELGEVNGDLISASTLTANATLTLSGAESGTLSDGTHTVTFTQIEGFALGSGQDTVLGGAGHDSVDAGAGNDTMSGGAGNDTLSGGTGNDTLDGGTGADSLSGGDGDDRFNLTGSIGNETLTGGEATETTGDTVNATTQTANLTLNFTGAETGTLTDGSTTASFSQIETFALGAGQDTVQGGAGNDSVDAGAGNDQMSGGAGNDTLAGGVGTDTLDGGTGNDSLTGGAGADVFAANGADTITDFDASTGISNNGNLDNDFVDLTAFYNATTLAAWNAANPSQRYDNALKWLQADQSDGVLQSAGNLRIQNGGAAVSGNLFNAENTAVCYAAGTRIATAKGKRPIERLKRGDLVETADHGMQEIRWVGEMTVAALGDLAPILIQAGALDNRRDLLVSPQHRMVIGGWQAELLFGADEVLVPAKMLVNGGSIRPLPMAQISYHHILFDRHEIIFAEGTPSESFHPGEEGFDTLGIKARAQILALFPRLMVHGINSYGPAARRSLRAHEAALLTPHIPQTQQWRHAG